MGILPSQSKAMELERHPSIDRQTLLASIPQDWEDKFKEELARSPLFKLVALQVSQQLVAAHRNRLEVALQSSDSKTAKQSSSHLEVSKKKEGQLSVSAIRSSKSQSKISATSEKKIEQMVTALNFSETSASYMWYDLTKAAFAEMENDLGQATLEEMDRETRLQTLYRYIFDEASDSLKSNFSTILQVYVDQAVQLILTRYDLPGKTLQELDWVAGLGKKALPKAPSTNPHLFANSITNNFATCKLLWESVNILTQRNDLLWQPDSEGKLAYTSTLKDGRGKLIFWVTDNPEEQYPEALAGEAALAVIETFDIRAACIHLIYAAHVTTLDKPWEEEFIIDDTQISSYLGLDKRKDLTKEKRLKLIERIAEQPAQILTFLHWSQQGSIESFYVEKSRLWEVAIGYHGQRDLFGDIQCTGLTIRCRAGMWAKYFLNKRGSEEGKAFYQYGVLSKTLLQTITRVWQHSEGAARMLAWLSFKIRVSTNPVMITSTLMEVAYGAEKLTEAQYERDLRSDLAKTWDNDLRILCDAGWIIEFDPATYPAEIQPDWKEGGRGGNKRPKGFWEQLRNSRLQIHPPKEIAEGIAKLQRRNQPTSSGKSTSEQTPPSLAALNGETIKAVREQKGWSQEELGNRVHRTKMWVSLIERGQRRINPKDTTQLREVLELD